MQSFKLIPFIPNNNLPIIDISGEIDRADNVFFVHFDVSGEIEKILISAKSSSPVRIDDLWKATCFEFFIAIIDQPGYWEFNMSPSGDWNVYRMDAYRKVGFREETAFKQLPFIFKNTSDNLSLDITVDLSSILNFQQKIQVGVTAIIQTVNGDESYWALSHPGAQADFHIRESFILFL